MRKLQSPKNRPEWGLRFGSHEFKNQNDSHSHRNIFEQITNSSGNLWSALLQHPEDHSSTRSDRKFTSSSSRCKHISFNRGSNFPSGSTLVNTSPVFFADGTYSTTRSSRLVISRIYRSERHKWRTFLTLAWRELIRLAAWLSPLNRIPIFSLCGEPVPHTRSRNCLIPTVARPAADAATSSASHVESVMHRCRRLAHEHTLPSRYVMNPVLAYDFPKLASKSVRTSNSSPSLNSVKSITI